MARRGADGKWDLTPFAACFPYQLDPGFVPKLNAELQYCEQHCPMASLGEGQLEVPPDFDATCFTFQVNKLTGMRVVYRCRRVNTQEWKSYAAFLLNTDGKLTVRVSELFNALPGVEHVRNYAVYDFPDAGHEYHWMVSQGVFLLHQVKQALTERDSARARVAALEAQLLQPAQSQAVVPQAYPAQHGGHFLAGYDAREPFNIWLPETYGAMLNGDPARGIFGIISALDAACGYSRSYDPMLRATFETARECLLAFAAEAQPFAGPWPTAIGKVLARLRDYVAILDGKDPHRARYEMAKADDFSGVDMFAAQLMQQKPDRGRGRGGRGRGRKPSPPKHGHTSGNARGAGKQG